MLRTYQPKKLHRKKEHGFRKCLLPTAEKFWQEEEQKAEKGCPINTIAEVYSAAV